MGSYNDSAGTSSFTGYLSSHAPDLLPGFLQPGPEAVRGGSAAAGSAAAGSAAAGSARPLELDHGTTIVAATYADGVVVAGDRRATMGSMIAKRDVRKVFRTDEYSVAGVAGTWSLAVSLMRLFQVELEHYEKLEGQSLSLVGKASRLAVMVKGNLGAAMQGLVVVPLFAGYDQDAGKGRIFSYDPFGGPYEESRFYSIGSGSIFARGSLKKLYTDDMPASDVILACVHALYDAADDDSATGGPDLARRLFPMIATVTADGFSWISDEESERYAREVVEQRLHSPDGPEAPLGGGAS